ncbi:hypothetical protein G6F65_016667 [Rhizopus arrhizus]|nr:hypothetical protein G6F65_016667 [Rhizopus arrhizus]
MGVAGPRLIHVIDPQLAQHQQGHDHGCAGEQHRQGLLHDLVHDCIQRRRGGGEVGGGEGQRNNSNGQKPLACARQRRGSGAAVLRNAVGGLGQQAPCLQHGVQFIHGKLAEHVLAQADQLVFQLADQGLAGVGQPQQVGAAGAGGALAADQVAGAQLVQQAHQRRPLHAQLLGQRHLPDAAAGAADHQQRHGARGGDPVAAEPAVGQALPLPPCVQQAGAELHLQHGALVEGSVHKR